MSDPIFDVVMPEGGPWPEQTPQPPPPDIRDSPDSVLLGAPSAAGTGGTPAPTGPGGPPAIASPGRAALAQAAGQLGNDATKYLSYWSVAGLPWCAFFVAWAVDTCPLGSHSHKCPWTNFGGVGWSGAVLDWGAAIGKALPAGAMPHAGDFYIVDDHEHVGIVSGAGHGLMQTINGNWGHPGMVKAQTWTHVSDDLWADGVDHHIRLVRL